MTTITQPTSEAVRIYECAVLLPSSLSPKERTETIKGIEGLFSEKEAKKVHKDEWGKRGLAYKIKGHMEGEYIIYYYEVKPEDVRDIDSALRLEKGVLRHLFVRVPDTYELVDWAKHFQDWLQERDREVQEEEKEREEQIKQKIVRRATKKVVREEQPAEKAPEKEVNIEKKLEEIISDEDLNL